MYNNFMNKNQYYNTMMQNEQYGATPQHQTTFGTQTNYSNTLHPQQQTNYNSLYQQNNYGTQLQQPAYEQQALGTQSFVGSQTLLQSNHQMSLREELEDNWNEIQRKNRLIAMNAEPEPDYSNMSVRETLEVVANQLETQKSIPTNLNDYSLYGNDMPQEMINKMMNDDAFQKAMIRNQKNEGGYVNDPDDPGRETKFGISARWYPNEDIKNLTRQRANAIYYRDYWLKPKLYNLPYPLDDAVFDKAVNQGPQTAVQHLHSILGITPGSIIGEETMAKLNQYSDLSEIVRAYNIKANERYDELVAENPSLKKYLNGWKRR